MKFNESLLTNRINENLKKVKNPLDREGKANAIVEALNFFDQKRDWVEKINREEIISLITNSKDVEVLCESVIAKVNNTPFTKALNESKKKKESKKLNESLTKPLKEEKLNEGTSNFYDHNYLPLLVFMMDDEIEAHMDYDNGRPKEDDFEDYDDYFDALEKFKDEFYDKYYKGVCILTEEEVDDLKFDLDAFNSETKELAYELTDDAENENWDLEDIKLVLEPGYYEGAQIKCEYEKNFDYLTEDVKKAQLERFNTFLDKMQKKYGLTKLKTAYRMSNGETGYTIIEELKHLNEGVKKTVKFAVPESEMGAIQKKIDDCGFTINSLGNKDGYDEFEVVGDTDKEDCWKVVDDLVKEINTHKNVTVANENLQEASDIQTKATKMLSEKKYYIDMAWKNGKTWKTAPMTLKEIGEQVGSEISEDQFVDMMSNNIKNRKDAKNLTKGEIVKLYDYMDGQWQGKDVLWSINEGLTEATGNELKQEKQELYKDGYTNLTPEQKQREREISCIEMIDSLICYGPLDESGKSTFANGEELVSEEEKHAHNYLKSYIEELGRDKVVELADEQLRDIKEIKYAGEDSEGVQYNSITYVDESLNESGYVGNAKIITELPKVNDQYGYKDHYVKKVTKLDTKDGYTTYEIVTQEKGSEDLGDTVDIAKWEVALKESLNEDNDYFAYMDKDYANVLDKDVDVYDIKQFVLDDTDNKYRTHYTDEYALIIAPNGKGCLADYEAIGQKFDSVDSEVEFGVEENKDNEYVDEQGNKHKAVNIFATHTLTTTPKEIMEKAPKKTMKYRDFFRKYKYNDRCASNFKELVSYIEENGGLQEGCHSKKKKALKEGYIGQTLEDFFYDCVDPDLIETVSLWGEDDEIYNGDYEGAIEEYDNNEFIEFDCGMDKVVINVDTSEEYQVTDYFIDVQDFIEFYNGDEIEVYDVNTGETLFSGDKYDLPDDVAEKIFVSFDAPKFISINIEEDGDSDDDYDESLKENKFMGNMRNYVNDLHNDVTLDKSTFIDNSENLSDDELKTQLRDYLIFNYRFIPIDFKFSVDDISDTISIYDIIWDTDRFKNKEKNESFKEALGKIQEVTKAIDCDGNEFSVKPIWKTDRLATLVDKDGNQTRVEIADLRQYYDLYDQDDEVISKFETYNENLKEDTVKQGDKWVNKGDTGKTHGEFKTKKEADKQRKAMFAGRKPNAKWGK